MSNVIVLILLIIVSYIIFFLEKENLLVGLAQSSFSNDDIENIKSKKYNTGFKSSNVNINDSNNPNDFSKSDLRIKLNQNPKYVDIITSMARKELNSNLKHLEFILTIENQFENLASKDRYELERLQEYVKIKRDVQLKIIDLSQTISYYQSNQINLC